MFIEPWLVCGQKWSDLALLGHAVTVHPAHWFSSAFSTAASLFTWILTLALHAPSVGNFPEIVHECFILVRQVYSITGVKEFRSWVYWILPSLEEFSHYCGFFARPEEWKIFLLKFIFTSFSLLLKDAPFWSTWFPWEFYWTQMWSLILGSSVGS